MKDIAELIELYIAERGTMPSPTTLRRLAKEAGLTLGGYRAERILREWRRRTTVQIPGPSLHPIKEVDNYPQIPAPALILSDLHIPFHDPAWIERVATYALRQGIPRLLIAGDLLDAKALSSFPTQSSYSYEEELEEAVPIINELARVFRVHIIMGNHDDRLARRLNRELSPRTVYRLAFPAAEVHFHHHALVGHNWLVAHPRNYSRVSGQPAHQLVAKFGRNVAIAHTHKWTITRDASGTKWVVETGGCFDPRRLDYVHRELSTMPFPQQGALIVDEEERPMLLHPELAF